MWFLDSNVVTSGNNRMSIHFCWSVNHPIAYFLFFKSTVVANEVLHFAPLVLACCHSQHLVTSHPQTNLATAFWAITMGIDWLRKPHSILKAESSVSQCTNGANVDNISNKI